MNMDEMRLILLRLYVEPSWPTRSYLLDLTEVPITVPYLLQAMGLSLGKGICIIQASKSSISSYVNENIRQKIDVHLCSTLTLVVVIERVTFFSIIC